MQSSSIARFCAVVLLSVPIAFGLGHDAQRKLNEIAMDPSAYLAHQRQVYHPGFGFSFMTALLCVAAIVFLVDGLEMVLTRVSFLRTAVMRRGEQ